MAGPAPFRPPAPTLNPIFYPRGKRGRGWFDLSKQEREAIMRAYAPGLIDRLFLTEGKSFPVMRHAGVERLPEYGMSQAFSDAGVRVPDMWRGLGGR